MILLIDNYDSFSFNLVQLIGELAAGREELRVIRNDELSVEEIMKLEPSHIVLSPGPGRPSEQAYVKPDQRSGESPHSIAWGMSGTSGNLRDTGW